MLKIIPNLIDFSYLLIYMIHNKLVHCVCIDFIIMSNFALSSAHRKIPLERDSTNVNLIIELTGLIYDRGELAVSYR